MSLFHFMITIPFIFAIIVPFLYKRFARKIHTGWLVLPVPIILFLYLFNHIPKISNGETESFTLSWIPSFNINYTVVIDGLSLMFGLLITGIGALVVLYSVYYLSKEKEALHNFYVYLLMFMGAMLGVVFSDNIFVLYSFWELTSVSSFLLIAYWYQRQASRYGAKKAMYITISGGLCMLAGFVMLSIMTNTHSIREMFGLVDVMAEHPLFVPAMIFILLGAFTKSAQFPFSIWLPDAMEAPTPVSAYLHSATMVKAGIYLVARLTPIFGGTDVWFWAVSAIGIITLLYGSINAIKQTDLKAMLAYSTISQLGLIMSLLGVGSAAVYFGFSKEAELYTFATLAAMFHLINHSTFKGALFMTVGVIDLYTGTRDIRKLGGLINLLPISFTVMLIGSFSMAGLPPFNGFLSKEMFFTGMLNAAELSIFGVENIGFLFPLLAWIASIFTFVYCMILVFKTFFGKYEPEKLDKSPKEAPMGMLISPVLLASFVIIVFFFPNILSSSILEPVLTSIYPMFPADAFNVNIYAWHGLNTELFMTIGVVAFGIILYKTLDKWTRVYNTIPEFLHFNNMYDASLSGLEFISAKITNFYMTGSLRHYFIYIFAFIIVIVGGANVMLKGITFDPSGNNPINIYEIFVIAGTLISAFGVLFARNRLIGILSLGALGYFVTFFFVIFRAPDLALTQFVVETVTTVLFFICFYFLPEIKSSMQKLKFNLSNFLVSVLVGLTVTIMALSAQGTRLFEPISYFFEDAFELAGANNIVNAILVDFRGMDTMGEILVLTIAGIGVYTLVKLNMTRRNENEKAK